jgi:hypothetical protein
MLKTCLRHLILLVGLSCITPLLAQDTPRWHGLQQDGDVLVFHGVAESDDVPLSFFCPARAENIEFTYAYMAERQQADAEYPVSLRAGKTQLNIRTVGERLELDDHFLLVGQIAFDTHLLALLNADGELEVTVGNGTPRRFPLTDARAAARLLDEHCTARRAG